tara:strand:- start:347 stop:703 length:357 start_codon:yes stop_codon:yes gene_type:complete
MPKKSFIETHPFPRRLEESKRVMAKYPDRIPVIMEKSKTCKNVPDIDRVKFLVPKDIIISQFTFIIRKRINISAEKAIFVFVNNSLPPSSSLMTDIYEEHKNEDGFLYMSYGGENTFG